MLLTKSLRHLPALAAVLLSSCRTPVVVAPEPPPPPPMYSWEGEGVGGPLKMTISLSEQKAQLYKGGKNVGWTYVATGLPGHPTPLGTHSIMEKIADKHSNRYGVICNAEGEIVNGDATAGVSRVPPGCRFVGAPMPNWMRITAYGIGMHAGHIPNPGSPASHGCIRLPQYMSERLFENAVVGTPVKIVP